jgi:fumarate hydratase class I
MIPNCAATRHAHFTLDGSGPAYLERRSSTNGRKVDWAPDKAAKRVDLDTLTPEEVQSWKAGRPPAPQRQDADRARRRAQAHPGHAGQGRGPLPVDFKGRAIYYVGPVDPVMGEVVGPAGPTTATRMDKFTDMMLELGLLTMIGKAERGPGRDAGHRQAQGRLSDGGRRRGLSRRARDQGRQGRRLRGSWHGSDLRVRGEGHAGDRRRRQRRQQCPQLAPLVWRDKIAKEGLLAGA